MKYSKEQRLLIGSEIYKYIITIRQVSDKYGVNTYAASDINSPEPMVMEK